MQKIRKLFSKGIAIALSICMMAPEVSGFAQLTAHAEVSQTLNIAVVTEDEKNDLYVTLEENYDGIQLCADLDSAIALNTDSDTANDVSGIMVLADHYPASTTVITDAQALAVKESGVRLYVEYPENNAALGVSGYSGTNVMNYNRGIITNADAMGMDHHSLLYVHGARFVSKSLAPTNVDAEKYWVVSSKVAGYDTAKFGLSEATYSLIEVNDDVMIAATKFSQFISARYAPYERYQQFWMSILSWVSGVEVTSISWEPLVNPSYDANEALASDAYAQAVEANAQWYQNSGFVVSEEDAKDYMGNSAAGDYATGAHNQADPVDRELTLGGDGRYGFLEAFVSGAAFTEDGGQLMRFWRRADCNGESAGNFALAGDVLNNDAYTKIAYNAVNWLLTESYMSQGSRADTKNPQYGLLTWHDGSPQYETYYGDDNARAVLGLISALAALRKDTSNYAVLGFGSEAEYIEALDKLDQRVLEVILGNYRTTSTTGMREAAITGASLNSNGWEAYFNGSVTHYAPHYQALNWATYLWAYAQTGYEPLLERTKTGIRHMMNAYINTMNPDHTNANHEWVWTNGLQQERAKMILPLAWLCRIENTEEHVGWLNLMIRDLMALQDEETGAIGDAFGEAWQGRGSFGPFTNNAAYGKHEAPVIQDNGDPCIDALYTSSFAMLSLNESAAAMEAVGNTAYAEIFKNYSDRLSDFFVRIQADSTNKTYDGVWFRGFDYEKWEVYGSDGDAAWGVWCTETGWTQAWISNTLSMKVLDTNIWDYTQSSSIEDSFIKTASLMLGYEPNELMPSVTVAPLGRGSIDVLTDKTYGSVNHDDGCWIGTEGKDITITVDYKEPKTFEGASIGFISNMVSGICPPASVTYFVSEDGENYKEAGSISITANAQDVYNAGEAAKVVRPACTFDQKISARYVKAVVKNAGNFIKKGTTKQLNTWIFMDELELDICEVTIADLYDILKLVRPLNPSLYVDGTGEALDAARIAAEEVYAKENAAADEINAAYQNLKAAYDSLKLDKMVIFMTASTDGDSKDKLIDGEYSKTFYHSDEEYAGWQKTAKIEVILDLMESTGIGKVGFSASSRPQWAIYVPNATIYVSEDQKVWTQAAYLDAAAHDGAAATPKGVINTAVLDKAYGRYVKFVFENDDDHLMNNVINEWIFIDEVIVERNDYIPPAITVVEGKLDKKDVLLDGVYGSTDMNIYRPYVAECNGADFAFVVDYGKEQTFDTVRIGALEHFTSGIVAPSKVEVLVSNDNETFTSLVIMESDGNHPQATYERLSAAVDTTTARYIKVRVTNYGKVKPGNSWVSSWVMLDEFEILSLADAKEKAKAEVSDYKSADGLFTDEDKEEQLQKLEEAKHAIDTATTLDAIDGIVREYKAAVDLYTIITNLALNKPVYADSQEANSVRPSLAVDGNTTARESRWGSDRGQTPHWIYVDLGEKMDVRTVKVFWELRKPTSYSIQVSDDAKNWKTVKQFDDRPKALNERIVLDETVEARYVRLYIGSFTAEDPDSTGVYDTVSIYELEVYSVVTRPGVQEYLSQLEVEAPTKEDTKLTYTMPELAKGMNVTVVGADYEQIVDTELNIHKPLKEKDVTLMFKVTDSVTGEEGTKEVTVTVPGIYETEEGDNEVPVVIPELAEWKGHTGAFAITDTTKLVINPDHKEALSYVAESFAADYEDVTGNEIEIAYAKEPAKGDFYFTLGSADAGLGEEGYLMTIADYVTVEAVHKTGAFWAVQTVMQILTQTDGTMPKGITRDYPKYEVRGFMLDVGRKPFSMDYIYETVKTMAYYKMNDLGLHLNDNYIFVEEYNNTETDQWGAYSAFRLESDVKEGGNGGRNKADLTAADLYYTKDEFRQLILDARDMGINIVPEFDTPAHSLAFTKVRPDLVLPEDSTTRWADHLNLANPESEEFIKSVWNEYITGDDPVFDKDTILNIGTDEYTGNNEDFRRYTANMINYVQGSGRTVRLWGSLSKKPGTTVVPTKDVQVYAWDTGWGHPKSMYDQGYNLISINDDYIYMVPNGSGNRRGYGDRLNLEFLYNSWKPNVIESTTIPSSSPQMLGASFAIWNDNIDLRENGLGEYDIFDRFIEAAPYIALKAWGEGTQQTYAEFAASTASIGTAPNTNPYAVVETSGNRVAVYKFDEESVADASPNAYDGAEGENTAYAEGKEGKALQLNGSSSYVTTGIEAIGPETRVSFWVKADADAAGAQILFDDGHTQVYMSMPDTGKVGFIREFQSFTFNYELPKDEWVYLTFKTEVQATHLYVNGLLTDTVSAKGTGRKHATLVFPLAKIGSDENAFTGLVDEVKVVDVVETELNIYLDEQIASVSAGEYYYDAKMAIISQLSMWNSDLEECEAEELPTMEELQAKAAVLLEKYEDRKPSKNSANIVSNGKQTSGGSIENASKYPTSNIIDGNLSTTCSTVMGDPENPAYVQLDLGESMVLHEMQVICYFNDGRWNKYDIYTSEDGKNFTLLENKDDAIGETSAGNWFDMNGVSARYIRLAGIANSSNIYFHVAEVKVYEKDADYSAVEAALASIPADLSNYTEESVDALNKAVDAVVYGLKAIEQDAVDTMAQAIADAVAGLKGYVLEIVTQPVDTSAVKGETAAVFVEATGRGLTYKWYYKNPGNWKFYESGSEFVSADGAAYTMPMYAWRDGQEVYCVITDANGESIQTNIVTLTMDNGSIQIIKQPEDVIVDAAGDEAAVTVEATGTDLTYTWYYKNPGNVKFYESGSDFVSADGAAYTIPVARWRDGQEVYCVITDANGISVQTDTVTLSVAK